MSLGSDLTGGFQAGLAWRQQRQDKKDKEAERELALARMQRDLEQKDLDRELRRKALEQDATLAREGWFQQAGAAERNRNWQSGERQSAQGFTAEQQAMDRELRRKALEQDAAQASDRMGLARAEFARNLPAVRAQTRLAEAQAQSLGQSQPRGGPTESVEFDPMTGEAISRKVTGPLGTVQPLQPLQPMAQAPDAAAIRWAQENPADPRAQQILEQLRLSTNAQ